MINQPGKKRWAGIKIEPEKYKKAVFYGYKAKKNPSVVSGGIIYGWVSKYRELSFPMQY